MLAAFIKKHYWSFTKWLFNAVVTAILVGIVTTILYIRWVEAPLTTITIPVLITADDNQGGQFALGVSRAINWAERFKLDEVGGRRIRPLFLNEDALNCTEADSRDGCTTEKRVEEFLASLDSIETEVPLVVGPLTSTHSKILIEPIAMNKGIPMVLGIPTRTDLVESFSGRVWRLSPTDDFQAKTIIQTLERLATDGQSILIIQDGDKRNGEYSQPLAEKIVELAAQSGSLPSPPKPMIMTSSSLSAVQEFLGKNKPQFVVYAGMPDQARNLLRWAEKLRLQSTFIFTDGCIDPEFIEQVSKIAHQGSQSRFLITFQAPPPSQSPGIESYIWFTRSMGGNVTGVVNRECDSSSGAISYEVFGFDAYMMALNLLREAAALGKPNKQNVEKVMANQRNPRWTFLLMSPYSFDEWGNNQKLEFHVYRIQPDGCVTHPESTLDNGGNDSLCPIDQHSY